MLFLLFFVFVNFSSSASHVYEDAAFEDLRNKKPIVMACCQIITDGGFGSGVYVQLENQEELGSFVLTAKHIGVPQSCRFSCYVGGDVYPTSAIPVVKSVCLMPNQKYNDQNDLMICFLDKDVTDRYCDLKPIVLKKLENKYNDAKDVHTYGYGQIWKSGFFPWVYSEVSYGRIARLNLSRVYEKGGCLRVEERFDPRNLLHPMTFGFSGGPLVVCNDVGEHSVIGINHLRYGGVSQSRALYVGILAYIGLEAWAYFDPNAPSFLKKMNLSCLLKKVGEYFFPETKLGTTLGAAYLFASFVQIPSYLEGIWHGKKARFSLVGYGRDSKAVKLQDKHFEWMKETCQEERP